MSTAEKSKLKPVSGSAYGVHIKGFLPDSFRQNLWGLPENNPFPLRQVEVQYKIVDSIPEQDEFWHVESDEPHARARYSLSKHADHLALKVDCQGSGLFRLRPSSIEIDWLPGGTDAAHYFFSYALPLWLERKDIPVLHASAVKINDHTVAFLGRSGMGKSTLCEGLVRLGHQFIADDGLALIPDKKGVWHCANGPPIMRLWPSNLRNNPETQIEKLVKVHSISEKCILPVGGNYLNKQPENPPLSAVYVLDRRQTHNPLVSITQINPAESVIHLIEQTMLAAPVKALGLGPNRLERLADIASKTRIAKLSYQGDFSNFGEISTAIQQDIAT